MRIAQFCTTMDLSHGGVVRAVFDGCTLLARAGHDVTLITHGATDVPASWRSGAPGLPRLAEIDPPTRKLLAAGALYGAAALKQIGAVLDETDVLHLHTPWEPANNQLAKLARERGVPYVLSVHGMLDDWSMAQRGLKKRVYLALVGRRLLENAAFIHCTAQAEQEQANQWYPRGRDRVIPLAFDVDPYLDLPGPELARRDFPTIPSDEPVILFLSRLHYKKGPDVLLDTVARLRDEGQAVHAVMAGDGDADYVARLERQASTLCIDGRVTFTGLVGGAQKLSLYEAADLFVLPTSQENFGMVFPEALACRTPVVTTRGVDTWRELEASGGGRIADRTAPAFAAAITDLLSDPERLRVMGESGREWVFGALTGERIVPLIEAMYREAIGEA